MSLVKYQYGPSALKYGTAIGTAMLSRYGNPYPIRNYQRPVMAQSTPGQVLSKRFPRKGKRSFKNALYKTLSAKHYSNDYAVTMTQQTIYSVNLTAGITQGTANTQRNGDTIVLSGLKVKGFYNTDTASNGYGFRVLVGYSGEEYTNTTFSAGTFSSAELFLPNTNNTQTTAAQINPKAFTILHDERLICNSQLSSVRDRVDYSFYVNLGNSKFPYQATASALGKNKSLYMIVTGDVLLGSAGETALGGTTLTVDLVFKEAN